MGSNSFGEDAFAVDDARALRIELTCARTAPALDPRLRPFLDRLRADLQDVRDARGLDAALGGLDPLLDALAGWPPPPGAALAHGARPPGARGVLSWEDRRVVRFGTALSALRALENGPDGEAGRRLALTAVLLGRRTLSPVRAWGSRARRLPGGRRPRRGRSMRAHALPPGS